MVEEVRIAVAHGNVNRILDDLSSLLKEINSFSKIDAFMLSPQGSCLIRIPFSDHSQCVSFTHKLYMHAIKHAVYEME